MRRLISPLLGALAALLIITGCANLEPGGVYADDPALYQVDDTYDRSISLLDIVFQWEAGLPQDVVAKWPEVREAVNRVRVEAMRADAEFHRLRDAYLAAPDDSLKTGYQRSLAKLTALAREAVTIYAPGEDVQ